jgi:sugar diacid utilization regulator
LALREGSAGVVQNILKDNLDALRQVSKMISAETGCNIIICDSEGEIIEATLPERIGRKHMGSALILAGDSDEAVITPELEEKYTQLGTDTRRGYNYVITILAKE